MTARTVDEPHRAATQLELLFDLTFVVAVAAVVAQLGHGVAEGHAAEVVGPFLQVFFAIWWAWMNFTWFASSYDFTPTSGSRLNLVETFFGIITRQAIRRGTFTSVTVLVKQIRDYINHPNTNPKPFTWTATADEILAKVQLVHTNIKKLVDNNAK